MQNGNCGCSEAQVNLMFKRAEQYVDDEIADRTYQMSRYWVDLFPVKPFIDGAGLILDKVRFFGDIGPQYDGYDGWRQVQISRPADALKGEHDGCGYNWEEVGHGMETVSYTLMQRDLRTKQICIKDIRTMFQYQTVQDLIFQNLANISANQREQLNRNAAMSFSIKHVALPGLPFNHINPYALPVIPSGVEVGRLTYKLLLQLYHPLVQEAAMYSLASLNGMPAFGVIAHPETLHDMTYEDPEIRKDMRHCVGTSCDLINRYNFLDSFGPFILMPDLYPPRYDRDANGVLTRIFPFDREVPIEIGTRPATNPAYHAAEFEWVQFMIRDLFTLRSRRPLTTVGGETDFDAEIGMFNWKWHNPERCEDPYRRVGRYVTTAEIGVEPGDFTDLPGILVRRKPGFFGIEYWGPEVCPPDPVTCDNVLPQGCPCPQVISVCTAVETDELVFTFDTDIEAIVTDVIEIATVNGGFVSGTVEEINTEGTRVRVSFATDVENTPGFFVELRCNEVSYCTADVLKSELCNIVTGSIPLILDRPIKAIATETITIIYCDGETADVTLAAVNAGTLTYTITLAYALFCTHGGISSVCVPTATNATCPSCTASELIDCVPEGSVGSE